MPVCGYVIQGRGQYDGHGEYCDLSTVSEVFLIFTTQINPCLCH